MFKPLFLQTFLFVIMNSSAAQTQIESEFLRITTIPWSSFRVVREPLVAGMSAHIATTYNIVSSKGYLAVNNFTGKIAEHCSVKYWFEPDNSWVVDKVLKLPLSEQQRLLTHEMGHHRIAILEAKAFDDLLKVFVFDPKMAQQQYDSLLKKHQEHSHIVNDQYERDTDHSRNLTNQAIWDRQILTNLIQVFETPDRLLEYKSR